MKKIVAVFAVLACILALSACSCAHESWIDGESGKACENCGISFCEVNGHSWFAATCEAPKSCENCTATEGEALGHSWTEADCENAKTCATCKAVEGEALGHSWLDATTETPKTCETCAATEGDRIITDERFKTSACSMLFGKWEGYMDIPGDEFEDGLGEYLEVFSCVYELEFTNDGKLNVKFSPADEKQFADAMIAYTVDYLYADFAASGYSAAEVDALLSQTYGMTVEEYVTAEMDGMNISEVFDALAFSFCYYVEDGQIYLGLTWSDMEADDFTLEGDTLYIPLEGEEMIPFTRVTE